MTRNELLGRLRLKGYSLETWAKEHGFKPDSVRHVVIRAYSGQIPKWGRSVEIWEKLLFTIEGKTP